MNDILKNHSLKQVLMATYIAMLTFSAYTCVYAFRKPFTVATFSGETFSGITYQTTLIISQVIGYMLSKFAGIRFISALKRTGRWMTGLILVGTAWFSLFLFGIVPPWAGILCFLVNGFMLGFMWGVVFSFAEGRRSTDFIGSVLAVSFIFAGGFTRSVAKWLMIEHGVTEKWMPFMTGMVFVVPLAILFFLLEKIPHPDDEDIKERAERVSMSKFDRKLIISEFGSGLVIIAVIYTMLTVMRDIRDNYMGNMWTELGYQDSVSVFTRSETKITLIILGIMSLLVLIRKNIAAFKTIHLIILAGFLLSGITSLLFVNGQLDGGIWMQAVGLGLYMAYIPFNAIFFERMIAAFRLKGNVGFLIYITDAFGYLGSVVVMLTKESMKMDIKWTSFYSNAVIFLSLVGAAGTIYAYLYFSRKYKLKFKSNV
jgi:MFS family permease